MNNESRKPVKQFKSGVAWGVAVSVWRNERGHSVTIRKTYKNKETGEWVESKGYFREDLAAIAMLMPRVIAWIDEEETRQRANQSGDGGGYGGGYQQTSAPSSLPSMADFNDDEIPF
jgi:hypothetical protein